MNRRQHLRHLLATPIAAPMLLGAGPAAAQAGPVRVFVGFPAGGLPDAVARSLAPAVGALMGSPAVVENRPGANGRLAAQSVRAAAPDGRTLLVCPASAMVHLPHVYKDLGYDPFTDFAPVAQLVENAFAFAISGKLPARNLAEWAAWCRDHPAQATFGSPGQGSSPHFMGVTLARGLGVAMSHIPYRGNNFTLTDVSGGHISGMVSTTGQLLPPHKAGQLRILGVTSPKRLPELPEVPTFAEQGVPALTLTEGTWAFAPARTPPAVLERLGEAVLGALKQREIATALETQADIAPLGPAALAARLRRDFDERGAGIRAAGFTAGQG
jgi:tripartite-type tricarboxylate transporter receptor subunit TctC